MGEIAVVRERREILRPLALAQPLLLAILLILVPLHIRRSRKEDRLLEEKFGQAYREYRKHTWF
jgi:protein-S-isoprenylcysteine O-methyltransferase Ste14